MNPIYLPTIESIRVKDFSLYPEDDGLDFTYNFINGVNLIIGGNGLGKTTFTSLIKYGIIGAYKKHKSVKTYKGEKRPSRTPYENGYFKDRMDSSFLHNEEARVTINFYIHEAHFAVVRRLYDFYLEEVLVTKDGKTNVILGDKIRQDKYDRLKENEKKKYLQYNYEQIAANEANLNGFDSLIFFVNDILFFGEDRKTVLWDEEVQETLSSKYFNDPELDEKREFLRGEASYHNSKSRHIQVAIKNIDDAIKRAKGEDNDDSDSDLGNVHEIKKEIESQKNKLDKIQKERLKISENRKTQKADKNKLGKDILVCEEKIKLEEDKIYERIWQNLTFNYSVYEDHMLKNHTCAMCNQPLDQDEIDRIFTNSDNCFLCSKPVRKKMEDSNELEFLRKEQTTLLSKMQVLEKELVETDELLEEYDQEYEQYDISLRTLKDKLRDLEYNMSQEEDSGEQNVDDLDKKLRLEVDKLQLEKKKELKKSKEFDRKASEITAKMDDQRAAITKSLSKIFSEYANRFLGVSCTLTFDDSGDDKGKRFIPVINGKKRLGPEALSESQRFFIDQSFRMSLLSFFYSRPTYFLCETPDGSLDISYELNAAEVFLRYLQNPNALILTSNLNNSEFLDYLIDKTKSIDYINLLRIGRQSVIQSHSDKLLEASKRVEEKINGKRVK